MIGILYFLEAYILIIFIKYLFYGILLIGTCWIIYKIYQSIKASYVLNHIDQVKKIEFNKPIRRYKTIYEETGYSSNRRYNTTHYRAKQVPKPLVFKGVVFFKNGKTVKFQIVENSKIYNELMKK